MQGISAAIIIHVVSTKCTFFEPMQKCIAHMQNIA